MACRLYLCVRQLGSPRMSAHSNMYSNLTADTRAEVAFGVSNAAFPHQVVLRRPARRPPPAAAAH